MAVVTYCASIIADPTKIKAYVDSLTLGTINNITMVKAGKNIIVFVEGTV